MKLLGLLLTTLVFVATLAAQDATAPAPRPENQSAPMHVVGIDVFPIANKPFSGRDCIDMTRHFENGSVQTARLDGALLARDGRGRIYREIRVWSGNPTPVSRLDYIMLSDPVAHTRTECKVAARSCAVLNLTPSSRIRPSPDGPFDSAPYYLHRVSLGSDMIENLVVEGTRITSSLEAGVFVNNEAPVASLDFWHSSELEIELSVTRTYKDGGTTVIHVVDLSRSEPDPSLFKPPQGFVVEDHRSSARVDR